MREYISQISEREIPRAKYRATVLCFVDRSFIGGIILEAGRGGKGKGRGSNKGEGMLREGFNRRKELVKFLKKFGSRVLYKGVGCRGGCAPSYQSSIVLLDNQSLSIR